MSQNTDPALLSRQAHAHYDAGRWNEAGTAYEWVLQKNPGDAFAWYRLGNVREEQGRDMDAIACFERSVALDPRHAPAWNNLGSARQRLGQVPAAEAAYVEAVRHDPALIEPRINLGRLAEARGDLARAAASYRAGLEYHPGNPTLAHLLAAARNESPTRAPAGYVAPLFDAQARVYERHLVEDLDYRVPDMLAALVRPALAAGPPGPPVLDLGCGTGLMGAALADAGVRMDGIDISPRMLERAGARAVYTQLLHGDIPEVLATLGAARYAAVLAADTFIYFGDLTELFQRVERVLSPGGLFGFSVEGLPEGRWRLQPTGRYAHALDYLRAMARDTGLAWRSAGAARIRRERQAYIEGFVVLLEKPAGG